ncbi:hypothetical protein GA0070616_2139 [Micromonospora nigra]|uniref:Copper(I)-binding protein n=1 Tax=Micromonospora nigra TaxID=145857 RepID=A0A1C6RUM0_9ACTN|nr:hypothetical protein [Micromonospora nigra]SCL20913.1 hypothetical protein GA0070616_2139 [Micromonospora nigra]
MTGSIRGRAALLLSGMAAAGLLLSGCGAGQISETALKEPSIQGVNLEAEDGEYAIRGLLVAFPGIDGYEAGDNAVLNAVIYNDSRDPVTVTITTEDARDVVIVDTDTATANPSVVPSPTPTESGAPSPTPTEPGATSPTATPSPSGSPAAPAGQPARIEIPPLSFVQLNTEGEQVLGLIGLRESLRSGQNVMMTFDFGNGVVITGPAPVAVPLTAPPAPPPVIERHTEFEGEDGH